MRTTAVTRNAIATLTAAATVAIVLVGAIGAEQKQAPPAAGAPKDFVIPSPKRFTLANGLPVTMVPFGQVPKVTIRLVVEAACTSRKIRSGSRI
jgi:zinc protease